MSIELFTDEDILNIADELNQRPRRILGYHSPTELFDMFLDEVYYIDNVFDYIFFNFNLQFIQREK